MDEKINELLLLLDNNKDLQKLSLLKKQITEEEKELILNYRQNLSIENKKKLYDNSVIKEYLSCENNLNYLIMEINQKFRRCCNDKNH